LSSVCFTANSSFAIPERKRASSGSAPSRSAKDDPLQFKKVEKVSLNEENDIYLR
jgi:hypothetical protein